MIDTFGIPLAFVLIASLSLWIIIGSKGWWWIKAGFVFCVIFFTICLWQSLETLQGWPTQEMLPENFEIKWVDVKEPNKKTKHPGGIYVWARNLKKIEEPIEGKATLPVFHNKANQGESRLHILPYSRQMHQQCESIKKQIASGKPYFGQLKNGKGGEGEGEGEGDGEGEGKGKGPKGKKGNGKGGDGDGDLSNEQAPMFHELPPAVLPSKVVDG